LFISGNKSDIILLNEVIPKAQVMSLSLLLNTVPNYSTFTNFDPNISNLGSAGNRTWYHNLCFSVSDITIAPESPGYEHLWIIRLKLHGSDSLLIGCIYRTPSTDIKYKDYV